MGSDLRRDAWGLVSSVAAKASVTVKELDALRDARRVNDITGEIWGDQPLHPDLLRALQYAGASLIGAEDTAGRLIGYTLAFVGLDAGGAFFHSHTAAVVPEWRNRGVGYALKLGQRAHALDIGLDEIRWTYDPMLRRNAWLNLVKLGAIANRFLPEFYGHMQDKQNAGDLSDRFEVCWHLVSPRVIRALSGERQVTRPPNAAWVLTRDRTPEPQLVRTDVDGTRPALVSISPDHPSLRVQHPALAIAWRHAARQAFTACFASGLVAVSIDAEGVYVFQPKRHLNRVEPSDPSPR